MFNILKIYVFLAVILILFCSCSTGSNYQPVNKPAKKPVIKSGNINSSKSIESGNNKQVQDFLGQHCLNIIKTARQVKSFRINQEQSSKPGKDNIQGYLILQKGKALNRKQYNIVTRVISSSSSYDFKFSKRVRIRPGYALRFKKYSKKVDVVIDFNTGQWAFYCNNRIMAEDITESAQADLQKIITRLFKLK